MCAHSNHADPPAPSARVKYAASERKSLQNPTLSLFWRLLQLVLIQLQYWFREGAPRRYFRVAALPARLVRWPYGSSICWLKSPSRWKNPKQCCSHDTYDVLEIRFVWATIIAMKRQARAVLSVENTSPAYSTGEMERIVYITPPDDSV